MTGRDKVVGVEDAVATILSGDTIVTGGFVGSGFPEYLAVALERRFLDTGAPAGLDLIFAAGQGDGGDGVSITSPTPEWFGESSAGTGRWLRDSASSPSPTRSRRTACHSD
jgi:hypothetical protein